MPTVETVRVILPKPLVVRIVIGDSQTTVIPVPPSGLRIAILSTSLDFSFTPAYFDYLVDASANGVTGSLPAATGSGQIYRTKKIDSSDNVVTIAAAGSDLIDGSISINLIDQWGDCVVIDAATGYWDAWVLGSGGVTPLDDTPTDLNEVIDGGSTLGFWP